MRTGTIGGLELVHQPVEVVKCAEVRQAKEPELYDEVSHIEQRIVLAKFIEIQACQVLPINDQMFGTKIAMGWALCPLW
jgi:hypothetical protein